MMDQDFCNEIRAFVRAYLLQRCAMMEDAGDKEVTDAVCTYMEASKSLLDYLAKVRPEEEPKLPSLEVFFWDGQYHDYARRIYAGMLESGRCHPDEAYGLSVMVEAGNALKELQRNEEEKGGRI